MPLAQLETLLREAPIRAIPLMFGAGVLTSLTPCVFPMIPITAGLLGGNAATGEVRRSRVIGMTAAYVTGLAAVYSALGLLAGLTGTLFGAVGSNPWAYFLVGNLLLVFGLALLDVFKLDVPGPVRTWAARLDARGPTGALLLGATSGLVAAPCGAPAFAAALTYVATTGSASLGFLYLFAFSLGMTALLALVGVSSGMAALLPRSGRWLMWIRRAGGVLLVATAEYYFVRMGSVL